MSKNGTQRQRQSEKLNAAEFRAFKKWVDDQPAIMDAQTALGVAPGTLRTLRLLGSGRPDTIQKVRAILTPVASC